MKESKKFVSLKVRFTRQVSDRFKNFLMLLEKRYTQNFWRLKLS